MTTLIPVLGDQLSHGLVSVRDGPAEAVVLMVEVADEAAYVRHHKKKIALILSAMRHFADELRAAGWTVDYVKLDDDGNTGSFTGEVGRAIERHHATSIRIVESGEWRVAAMIDGWAARFGVPVEVLPDDRFLCSRADFAEWAAARKRLIMEDFYREMRKRTGLLMAFGKPIGTRWNFDADNRKVPPRGLNYPAPPEFEPDAITREVLDLVGRRFGDHFGDLDPFGFAVTRAQALVALDHFITVALPRFGDYQDAIVEGQAFLYHAILSPYLNCGLLTAHEVAHAAADAFARGDAPLNAVEGFVRQVIGWREYVRGIYWHAGPEYKDSNALGATRDLPEFYWTGDTDLRCIAQSVAQVRAHAYNHHIQRLMVLGNFAMLIGVEPAQIEDWFLVVYADAYEWVELPNVHGMSQFADGGLLGSKPYAGGGAYIDRMSDHCGRCRYDVKQKTGPDACPFNALYWDFLARHRELLKGNSRLWRMYDGWDRLGPERQAATRASAAAFMATLPPAARGWAVAE
ncbi:cryptochrome/photolyase family protein [Polymorphobacter sp. PAMC 29334]|uniref:cryptochrome/photolyase family protein n=1 Tax=Polymorphobacter sp. PAMC 29334 TaxID=2862331 RepID=UPI001C73EDBB|nr:cryptochrome/photolyase family protein [Polymorphobacter sp. PAMC 29334]QYE36056.1 cryptochrome/photolyase family protein [Polymorphobacter sp. PAMC 29334]